MDRASELVLFLAVTSLLVTSLAESRGRCGDNDGVMVPGGQRQSDGSLVAEDGTRFPPGCFWSTPRNIISGCPGKIKPCVPKCCSENQAMNKDYKCIQRNTSRSPQIENHFDFTKFHRIFVNPCFISYEAESKNDTFTIYDNGSLFFKRPDDDDDNHVVILAGNYCQENIESQGNSQIKYLVCLNEQDLKTTPKLKFLINSIGVLISLPFLVATLVVYAVIPELRNLHGKCLMSHVVCLCVAFVCLALIQMGIDLLSTAGCIAAALIVYFFLLASFFWLNVMCFDIWWAFSGYRSRIGPKDPRDRQKFVYYSLYAWGAALVLLCVCATMQFNEHLPKKYLRPNFGEYSCWFDDEPTKWAYFHGPLAVLLACNLIFFSLTALSLWKIKKQTAILIEGKDSQCGSNRESGELRFKLYLKLFVVMGVPWTLEIISTIVGGPDYIWWLTDLANVLVGIPIFIIFVWKSKVRQLFLAKLNIKMGPSSETSALELT